jgi:hypothetical protein
MENKWGILQFETWKKNKMCSKNVGKIKRKANANKFQKARE